MNVNDLCQANRVLSIFQRVLWGLSWYIALLGMMPSAASQTARVHSWTTSRVKGTPDPPPPYTLQRLLDDVPLDQPTEMVRVPGTDRWIVCELSGRIHSFSKHAERRPALAINIKDVASTSPQVFGITFHPDYPRQPWCYIAFMAESQSLTGTRLSRFRVTDTKTPVIDPNSETVLARWNSEGHSGGSLHFGADGYLYVSVGDGQNPNPPDKRNTGQDLSDLEASVLRIDVDHQADGLPYRIPEDNPFVGQAGVRGEIWAFGFRNPWKMAFDPVSGTLWTGDVGWEMMEMVYRIDRGANYGWSVMEGSQVVKEGGRRAAVPITPPIVEHTHLEARSITGGYFWHSDRLPELQGAYLYGDWMTGKIWGVRHDGEKVTWQRELADTPLRIICFALDDDGEVLVVGYDGTVHRLVKNTMQSASAAFPRRLSETGLFQSTVDQIPAVGVTPYEINAHSWSDGTRSQQWVAIPGDQQLGIFDSSDWKTGQVKDNFIFPLDTVLAKTIFYQNDVRDQTSVRRIETQLLHRNGDDWNAYNYVWNDDQTDAVLQDNIGVNREIAIVDPSQPGGQRLQTWHHASRDECLLCHIWRASTVHGFKLEQLDRPDELRGGNQLDRLAELGLFVDKPKSVVPLVSPYDANASLDQRARSYLHMNCAHCHRRGGGGTAPFELVSHLPLQQLNVVDVPPSQGGFELPHPKVIAAGAPSRSVLMYRLVKSGRGHMPQFGPMLIDDRGVRLIADWIASLGDASDAELDRTISQLLSAKTPLSATAAKSADRLLSDTGRALALAVACYGETVDPGIRREIAQLASRQQIDSSIRDLFEHFLPEDQRVKRLGTAIDSAALLSIRGDADAGGRLWESADVSCRQCHQLGGQGSNVGPDLSSIGIQRTPEEILESIVRPSAKIDDKYRGKLILTVDGTVLSGLVVQEEIGITTIVEPSGKQRTIQDEDIESIRPMEKSVMPEMLLAEFTAQQAADLIAYLVAQKRPLAPRESISP